MAGAVPGAHAYTTDLPDFNLDGSWSFYPGGPWHISSGGSLVQYRWLTSTSHDNVVSATNCSGSEFGSHYFNAGVTAWRSLFSAGGGTCFLIRGRTAGGATMVGHDGRIDR